jgi:hypothetical protein
MDLWQLLKDILLTGTGMLVVLSQVFSPHPSDVLLVTGLALTVPSVAGHAGALLTGRPGHTELHSSPPGSSSSPPPPSSSPSGVPGEGA